MSTQCERRLSPREAVEKAAAILHLEGLRLYQVVATPHQRRELEQDRKVHQVPSADSEPELFVMTCSGRVRVT